MAEILYNFVVGAYFWGIRFWAFFDKKARLWVDGRKDIFTRLEKDISSKNAKNQQVVWMHCASLGEFEQGRTVLEALKKQYPAVKILLTFFSPSGYEIRKNYPHADWVYYLPADTSANAQRFLDIVRPSLVLWVKYEFWWHYLTTLNKNKVPVLLLSALFREGQPFFSWYGGLHREMLSCFTKFFLQNTSSLQLLKALCPAEKLFLAGDTRVDRVLEIAKQEKEFLAIKAFCGNSPTLVCGSTWEKDEALLCQLAKDKDFADWKFIIAPHDIQTVRIQQIMKAFGHKVALYSNLKQQVGPAFQENNVLIIDNIGMLAWLYRFGKVAYIGGGFGAGIHNTLEPIAFGLPVLFGPRFEKFEEAKQLVKSGGAFSIKDYGTLKKEFSEWREETTRDEASKTAQAYIRTNCGATDLIMAEIRKLAG